MAANKSSSSPVTSNRPNPNARNSEIKDPMRRSFTGSPFQKPSSIIHNSRGGFNPNTPANSPAADFPRRSSFGREGFSSLRDFEDKENNKDPNLKPGRIRSPISASKGTKNFMSPTISAAYKFTPSPRKKILVDKNEPVRCSVSDSEMEKNEPVRSSVSASDAKAQVKEENGLKTEATSSQKKTVSFADAITFLMANEDDDLSKSEMEINQKIEVSTHDSITNGFGHNDDPPVCDPVCDTVVPLESDFDIHSSLGSVTEDKDCVNLDPTFKISPRSSYSTSSSTVAPLDAYPFMPPYDPKTNYLSPRPQFLHYRPNPRIEHIRNKDRDGKRLEENFVSENLSDTEVSEIQSEESVVESEDSSAIELVQEEEEEEDAVEVVSEAKELRKPRFFTRSKFIVLLVALMFACFAISLSNFPVTDVHLINDLSSNLYIPPEITEFTNFTVEEMAHQFQLWLDNAFSYTWKLVSDIGGGRSKLGPLQYSNLTVLLEEDHSIDGNLLFSHSSIVGADFIFEGTDPFEDSPQETEPDETIEDEVDEDIEANNKILEENHSESESEELYLISEAEVIELENSEVVESEIHNDVRPQSNIEVGEQSVVTLEATEATQDLVQFDVAESEPEFIEIEPEVPEAGARHLPSDLSSYAEIESTKVENIAENSESVDASSDNSQGSPVEESIFLEGSEIKDITKNAKEISSMVLLFGLVAAVIVPALFLYAKRGSSSTPNAAATTTTPVEKQPEVTKKLNASPVSVAAELNTLKERMSSRNWESQVDTYAESCPSEMSSFNKSSSTSKKNQLNGSSEAHSKDKGKPRRDHRRESLASSELSMGGSPSYGSFTTYEKIHSKHVNGVEEVITPVRRSSRIRKQVTSP